LHAFITILPNFASKLFTTLPYSHMIFVTQKSRINIKALLKNNHVMKVTNIY